MAGSKKKETNNNNKNEKRWKTLRHSGIIFPPEYESRGFSIRIRGKEVKPDLLQEEMAYQWAKKKNTPYVQDAVFQSNFTRDLAAALGPEYKGLEYKDVDFEEAYRIVDMEKDRKDAMTKEERKAAAAKRKEIREKLKAEYGKAVLDGQEVDVGNYMAEPPGIFIGRGAHPLRGKWKPRITKEDVILNMSKDAPRPEGQWKSVIENRGATWLASWTDYLTQKTKYVWLADTSEIKQSMDKAKYLKAETLSSGIAKILDRMAEDMASRDSKKRKISTVCYMIYRTAMRVGDEKDPDEADTVGATTLRKEHVTISGDAIKFDFLGKDSVRWEETIPCANPRDERLRANLGEIISGKKPKDEIFDGIRSSHVNAYYSGIVKGLSAKVFRTYSATKVVKKYLAKHVDDVKDATPHQKIYHAKRANLEAAIMCNHKRTIPKNFEESLKKKETKYEEAKGKKPWEKAQANLKKAKNAEPKTETQKKNKRKRIRRLNEQIKRQKARHRDRLERMDLQIKLVKKTRDYNLGTSLRNYIDPRVVKAWTGETKTEWEKLYTAALQRKFLWVHDERLDWSEISETYGRNDEFADGTAETGAVPQA
ncbi:MAG: DNA topoisomerase I [Thaumarchaeota archaeon]|nr:DNA topoisomerase I [Nitrososphaerota archaeon]MDE0266106.1 DNA topoisomerase I [Nitrososphaerota archaeon]MDE0526823.1 DNA topoisomerase I [Nitrososphaerota archaeon]